MLFDRRAKISKSGLGDFDSKSERHPIDVASLRYKRLEQLNTHNQP